jgi:hypothetical protein
MRCGVGIILSEPRDVSAEDEEKDADCEAEGSVVEEDVEVT